MTFCRQPLRCGKCWGLQPLGLQSSAAEVQASLFQKPMHRVISVALPCALSIFENVSLQGSDEPIAPQVRNGSMTNSLCMQSHYLLFSFPFQSALYYPRAAHRVCGLPGSFALSLSSSAGSILPFQV